MTESNVPSKSQSMDYLDRPPQRYRKAGNKMFEAADGEWVKFADMDLYMFEGGQLMIQSCAYIDRLRAALVRITNVEDESSEGYLGEVHEIAESALSDKPCEDCGGTGTVHVKSHPGGIEVDGERPCGCIGESCVVRDQKWTLPPGVSCSSGEK